jgi:hypothetical protein
MAATIFMTALIRVKAKKDFTFFTFEMVSEIASAKRGVYMN